MHVVWCTGPTLRTIIEHHQLLVFLQQAMNLSIVAKNALWLMFSGWYGKMHRQDGEGIQQQFVTIIDVFYDLLLRTVVHTEEAGSLRNGLLVDFCSSADHTGRIELYP